MVHLETDPSSIVDKDPSNVKISGSGSTTVFSNLSSLLHRFRIQVNDKGEDNDNDKYHVAYSWVVVKLRDINDNKPVFERSNVEAKVSEDAKVGKGEKRT